MGAETTPAGSGGAHGQQGAAAGGTGDPARPSDDASPVTIGGLKALLAEEREAANRRMNAALAAARRRQPKAPERTASTDEDDGDDLGEEDEGEPPEKSGTSGSRRSADAGEPARLKAMERELRVLRAERKQAQAEREQAKAEKAQGVRESELRAHIQAATTVDSDDILPALLRAPALKTSEDGLSFYVQGKDGTEVPLDEWVKKQVEAKPHWQERTPKEGGGTTPRSVPGRKPDIDPKLQGAALIHEVRRRQREGVK